MRLGIGYIPEDTPELKSIPKPEPKEEKFKPVKRMRKMRKAKIDSKEPISYGRYYEDWVRCDRIICRVNSELKKQTEFLEMLKERLKSYEEAGDAKIKFGNIDVISRTKGQIEEKEQLIKVLRELVEF